MSLALAWLITINLLVGGIAYIILRALYLEVLAPNFERWQKKRNSRKKR